MDIDKIIQEFENAAVDRSWLGAMHPDDRERIEYEYNRTKKILERALDKTSIYDRISKITGVSREQVKKVAHALAYNG